MSITDTAGGAKCVPALRFPEFEGEWASIKAGDAFRNSRAKGEAGLPLYSVTMDRGLVPRDTLEKHMHGNAADETNLRAQKGDIVYNMMRMWQGAAGISELECMVSPAYVVLTPKKETSSGFFNYRIENARMLYLLWAYSHGLTSDRLRLYYADFARIPMRQPSLPEQKKIAAFLGVVDAKIAGLKARQEGLERYKRGLMQALFSQRLRFTKPDGTAFPDWEEKQLGEVVEVVSGLTYSPDDIRDDGLLVLRSSNVKSAAITLTDQVFVDVDVEADKLTQAGDILLCVRNGSQRLIGKSALVPENMPKATHGAFMSVLRGANNALIFQLMQTELFFREVHKNLGATINSINSSDLKKFKFWLPKHPDEQQKIAGALQAMDAKIAAVAGQVATMEDFKKGLLQQMFV